MRPDVNRTPCHTTNAKVFISDRDGPEQYVAFFEDDGETGYLYVLDRNKDKIIKYLQIYSDSKSISPQESDIDVVWSSDLKKCAVLIFGAVRGIIDLDRGLEGRAKMIDRSSPAISDTDWLRGFEAYLVK